MAQQTARQCPKCKNGVLDERVKRGFFVKYILSWRPYKRYRCNRCNEKSYVLVSKSQKKAIAG